MTSQRIAALGAAGVFAWATIGADSCGTDDATKPEKGASTGQQSTTAPSASKPKPKHRSLSARLKQAVIDVNLEGEGKVRVETTKVGRRYDVLIYHELAENLTGGLMQRGAELDATKIFKEVYTGPDRDKIADATVLSTAKLIDQLGNEHRGVAFSVTLPGGTGRKINWSNVDQIDLRKVWTLNVDRI